ncbi:hypothetical protein [Flavobacterium sharifuzzamanii]|uniref:hypothetical protein n=1 Tax=Flavobacterium sharifuzzamanii TaxID=2211133 RepID=UPI000DABEEDC|nr:hypothetical protein [Flavobacterium sharifuzzamanii]KAF2080240.1 hypothetical protein DMA14_13135 [Flavobacterium sharifuzzamanii]
MKKIYLFAIISLIITSCTNDETKSENAIENNSVLNFSSLEKMEQKIDEISAIKAEMDSQTSQKYISKSPTLKSKLSENSIIEVLKNYHSDRLIDISNLRKNLNFVSIQSIADEINSLQILNADKANKLFYQHRNFLKRNNYNQVETIFENRSGEVINEKGNVSINGIPRDFTTSQSTTGKFITSSGKQGSFLSPDKNYIVLYSAGRQTHEDDFGKTFFRYYTEFQAVYRDPTTGFLVPCPSLFGAQSSSYAGFSQSGDNPFADFAITMAYPSGSGSSLRSVGGQKWTAYQPEGGYIKGVFGPLAANTPPGLMIVDFQYDSGFLEK